MPRPNAVLAQPCVGYMDSLRSAPTLPLALLHAAALARDEFEIRIFDQRLAADWRRDLDALIDDHTLVVGCTAFTGPMLRNSLDIAEYVKARHPQIPTLWGGIHASLLPEQTAADPHVDFVIKGEGEAPLLQVLRALRDKSSLDDVPGLYYTRNGAVIESPGNNPLLSGDVIPPAAFDLIDVNRYLPLYRGARSLFFQASRGCPYPCTYCYNTIYNEQKFRPVPAGDVIRRLGDLKAQYDFDDVYLLDDNFFVNLEWAKEIIHGMDKLGLTWQAQGVDIINLKRMDNAYYRFMSDHGCQRITIGVETGSAQMRKQIKKAGSNADILKTLERTTQHGDFIIYLLFMAGFPTETVKDLEATVRLIFRLLEISPQIRTDAINNFTPYPGTELYNDVVREGLWTPPASLKQWADEWAEGALEKNRLFADDPRKQHFYEALRFASQFLDTKVTDYAPTLPLKLGISLYRPIARYRVRNLNFRMMWEQTLGERVQNFYTRKSLYTDAALQAAH